MCGSFAFLSILQTLNSRYLFKDLHFDYYTFVHVCYDVGPAGSKNLQHHRV